MRLFLLFLLLLPAVAHADSRTGMIRICRVHGIESTGDHKTILIPKGAQFAQKIPSKGWPGDETLGAIIKTTAAAKMGPAPACATAPAHVAYFLQPSPPITGKTIFAAQFDDGYGTEYSVRAIAGFK